MTRQKTDALRDKIDRALENAKANGYDLINCDLPAGAIATDMMDHDADLEGETILEVCEIINSIRAGF